MVVKYNKEEADFILESLKDYKRLIKKYYGNAVIMVKLETVIEKAEHAKAETIKAENLMTEKEARGESCEICQ